MPKQTKTAFVIANNAQDAQRITLALAKDAWHVTPFTSIATVLSEIQSHSRPDRLVTSALPALIVSEATTRGNKTGLDLLTACNGYPVHTILLGDNSITADEARNAGGPRTQILLKGHHNSADIVNAAATAFGQMRQSSPDKPCITRRMFEAERKRPFAPRIQEQREQENTTGRSLS